MTALQTPGVEESEAVRRTRRLRRHASAAEKVLWRRLRGHALGGLHFRRQHPIGEHVVDFCCVQRRLVVELEGFFPTDPQRAAEDEARTRWLRQQGYRVLRFEASAVWVELDGVLEVILKAAER